MPRRDRSLIIELPRIPSDKKRTEKYFYRELEEARPKVLGALLGAVSEALGNLARVELKEKPRMADFAVWAPAAEQAPGLEERRIHACLLPKPLRGRRDRARKRSGRRGRASARRSPRRVVRDGHRTTR